MVPTQEGDLWWWSASEVVGKTMTHVGVNACSRLACLQSAQRGNVTAEDWLAAQLCPPRMDCSDSDCFIDFVHLTEVYT
jgi:hypothetical protein